uniref:Epoxide hydrolase n=1 Tax=Debaryomyces hansenii TaxID=4959 RepID=Q1KTB1_DEBHN|nr:epoxide hydrolase [Debaryomyces hansenii]
MMQGQYKIQLQNGQRVSSTLSNYDKRDVFCKDAKRKWTRVIFLLHGFPDNNTSYNNVWKVILESVPEDEKVLLLAPSMRGYEPSSQGEQSDYRMSDLANDVKSWITSISPDGVPVHLLGHDWGAIVAFKTASMYPELVRSMACLAIPYITNIRLWEFAWYCPDQIYHSSYMFTMSFPWLYKNRLSDTSSNSYLDRLWRCWSPTWDYTKDEIDSVKRTFKEPGVIDASTAYYRCLANPLNISDRRWKVDFEKVPTLLLGGERDGCMNVKLYHLEANKLASNPHVSVKILSNVGHFLHREDPTKVGELISDWFSEYP